MLLSTNDLHLELFARLLLARASMMMRLRARLLTAPLSRNWVCTGGCCFCLCLCCCTCVTMSQISYPCPYSDPFEIKQSQAGGEATGGGDSDAIWTSIVRMIHAPPQVWWQGEHIMASRIACRREDRNILCAVGGRFSCVLRGMCNAVWADATLDSQP